MAVTRTTAGPTVLLPSRRARLGRPGRMRGAARALRRRLAGDRLPEPSPSPRWSHAFTAYDGSDAHAIVRELRVPRTELGLLVGAALGAAGALMQGATRNPLAEPGILGINAGAAFAVVVAIKFFAVGTTAGYMAFALFGAAVTAVLVYVLGATGRGASAVSLALAGSVLAALFVSLTSAVLVFDARTLDEFRHWSVGSLAGRGAGVASPWRRSSPRAC